jgi:hypothetical protein
MTFVETPTVSVLLDLFVYDSVTGVLTRRRSSGPKKAGDTAGHFFRGSCKTYRAVRVGDSTFYVHRIVWKMHYGVDPDGQIDHVDGDGTNNAIANLRVVDAVENHRNQRLRSSNKSGILGVSKDKRSGKWRSSVTIRGHHVHLGVFDSIEEAAAARELANREYGFHENHGASRPLNVCEELQV